MLQKASRRLSSRRSLTEMGKIAIPPLENPAMTAVAPPSHMRRRSSMNAFQEKHGSEVPSEKVTALDFSVVNKFVTEHTNLSLDDLMEALLWNAFSAEQMCIVVEAILFSVDQFVSVSQFLSVCCDFYKSTDDDEQWVPVTLPGDTECDSKRAVIVYMVLHWLKNWDGIRFVRSNQSAMSTLLELLQLMEKDTDLDLDLNIDEGDEVSISSDDEESIEHKEPSSSYNSTSTGISSSSISTANPFCWADLASSSKKRTGLVKLAVELEDIVTYLRTTSLGSPTPRVSSMLNVLGNTNEFEEEEEDEDGLLWFLDHTIAKNKTAVYQEYYEYPPEDPDLVSEGSSNRPRSLSLYHRKGELGTKKEPVSHERSSDLGGTTPSWMTTSSHKGMTSSRRFSFRSNVSHDEFGISDVSSIQSEESCEPFSSGETFFTGGTFSTGGRPVFETGLKSLGQRSSDLSECSSSASVPLSPLPPGNAIARHSFAGFTPPPKHRRSASSSLGQRTRRWLSSSTSTTESPRSCEEGKQSSKLLEYTPEYVARQFTVFMHQKLFSKITLTDIKKLAKSNGYSQNIQRMIWLFDVISSWVETETIAHSRMSASSRIRILIFFLRLAVASRELKNYHLLFALVAGLGQPTLTWVWELAQTKDLQQFKDLQRVVSPQKNYLVYRADLSKCAPGVPKIPFLGVLLKDITILNKASDSASESNDGFLPHLSDFSLLWRSFNFACDYLGGIHVPDKSVDVLVDPQVQYLLSMSLQQSCTDSTVKFKMSATSRSKFLKSKKERVVLFFKNMYASP